MKKTVVILFLITISISCAYAGRKNCANDIYYNHHGFYADGRYYYNGSRFDYGYSPYYDYYYYGYTPYTTSYYYSDYYYSKYRHQAAYEEIQRLEQKKTEADAAKKQLNKIKVLRAKFYKQYTTDTLPFSVAEVTVENKSDYAVSAIYFKGSIITHKTSKILIDDSFSYFPEEILEPGAKATYKIHLNEFGNWSKIKQPPDLADFQVSVSGFETADHQSFRSDLFTPSDQKKLNELKKEYAY